MFETITLPNGVRILHEHIPSVRSAALGIWVGTGSRYESAAENGSSHFIEHMLFKGTKNRSAQELARESDAIGGQINAYTTKEHTCFYGHVLDTHLPILTDILSDMFFNSLFQEEDVENERRVIFEEIDMYEDDPEDLVHEQLFLHALAGNGLARPVLGTKKSLNRLTADSLRQYHRSHYNGSTVVISLSGSYVPGDIERLSAIFSDLPAGSKQPLRKAPYTPCLVLREKDIEQNHLVLAYPCIEYNSESRFAYSLMSSILGGSASSRLFQSVREQHALCYGISAGGFCHLKEGIYTIHTALNQETEEKALKLILEELDRLKQDGVTVEELTAAREQTKANLLMSLESTVSRMNQLGRGELLSRRVTTVEEVCARYDAVTLEDVRDMACAWLDNSKLSFSAVGRLSDECFYRGVLGL